MEIMYQFIAKIVIILSFFSCSKEQCKPYNLVTETNEKEAKSKCNGLANNYPSFTIISSQPIGCLTEKELLDAKKGESFVTRDVCNGVIMTVKITVK